MHWRQAWNHWEYIQCTSWHDGDVTRAATTWPRASTRTAVLCFHTETRYAARGLRWILYGLSPLVTMSDNAPIYFFNLHRLGDYGAPQGLTAPSSANAPMRQKQDGYLLRIEKLHKMSTRTFDCELLRLQNCYMRYSVGVI